MWTVSKKLKPGVVMRRTLATDHGVDQEINLQIETGRVVGQEPFSQEEISR